MKAQSALSAFAFLGLSLPVFSDTITFKDGTTAEGRVLSETADSYVLEVQVTKSIRDERKVAKSEVEKIVQERADLKDFATISKLTPAPDLLSAEDYAARVAAVEKFLKAHPSSLKAKDAKEILAKLQSEAAVVSAGGIKFGNNLLTAAEYKANAYELDARVREAKIRALLASGQNLAAIRISEDLTTNYPTTLSFEELSATMKEVIQSHAAEASQALQTLPARIKRRESDLQGMSGEALSVTSAAIKEETQAVEARYKAEKDAKQTWVTPDPFHQASLDDTVKAGDTELKRIAAIKPVLGTDGGKAFRDAYAAVTNGASEGEKSATLAAARTAGIPANYLTPLETAGKGGK